MINKFIKVKILPFWHRSLLHLLREIAQKRPFLTQKGLFFETVYSKKRHNIKLIYQFTLCSSGTVRLLPDLKNNQL